MTNKDRIVHGSFDNSQEAIAAIEKLKEEGYTREQIRVYGDRIEDKDFDKTEEDLDINGKTYDKTENDIDVNDEKTFDKTESDPDLNDRKTFDKTDRTPVDKEDTTYSKSDSADDDDDSLWDKIKDFFTSDSYDYDEESQNPNYRKEDDVLYPHRNDLSKGNRIIVLDKANENQTRVNI